MRGFDWKINANSYGFFMQIVINYKNRKKLKYEFWLVENQDWANANTIPVTYDNTKFKCHCNCSGDFFLMHQTQWYKLHGHPQNTYLPIHTDAISIAMAFYSGIKEHVFFYPVYHQDHERRFDTNKEDVTVYEMFKKFEADTKIMEKQGQAIIYNDNDWGFEKENFEEITFNPL